MLEFFDWSTTGINQRKLLDKKTLLLEKSKKYGRHIFVAVLTPTLTGKKKIGRGWQQTERDLDGPALSL